MAQKSQKKEEELFYEALETPPGRRKAHLKAACGDDQQLYQRVEALLQVNDLKDGFLQSPVLDSELSIETPVNMERPGTTIGRYKLLEQIGEGGMAVVYMAEQERPIRRKVALKIIKLGMDTKQVIARFEAERQALAMMDHPNIAKVLDAGATETGRPYFVMELVTGVSITEYCDKNRMNLNERLRI
ncbi:MAG: protein kinase, partial [Sedimentisphaerales bacterium]|nr:protein kinase [Sedimentisphaerales bacterium]